MKIWILLFISLIGGISGQCFNEQGEPRTWFVMLKMPNRYSYLYADNKNTKLLNGAKVLTDSENPVARVLKPIYNKDVGVNFILYNDQPPDGSAAKTAQGHAKGAVVWKDDSTIQWLIHSVPNFPRKQDNGYFYPESGEKFGQSFLCVSMQMEDLQVIANYLYYTYPKIYESSVNEIYKNGVRNLKGVLDKYNQDHVKESPWKTIMNFYAAGEGYDEFIMFAKAGQSNEDIYKDMIARYFQGTIFVETWERGSGVPSNCTAESFVYNVCDMKLLNWEYKETQDHSKWAVTEPEKKGDDGFFCVGDLNRMTTQFARGGGSACLKSSTLSQQIRKGIWKYEECSKSAERLCIL